MTRPQHLVNSFRRSRASIFPAGAGVLSGLALHHTAYSPWLTLIGAGILLHSIFGVGPRSGAIATAWYVVSLGLVGACWIPEALTALHASQGEAYAGAVIAVAWSAVPHMAALIIPLSLIRAENEIVRVSSVCLAALAADALVLQIPGGVPWTLWAYTSIENLGLSQLAAAGGPGMVSAVIAGASWSIGAILRSQGQSRDLPLHAAIVVGFAAISVVGLPFARALQTDESDRSQASEIRFVAIQPNLPRVERVRPEMQSVNLARILSFSTHAYLSQSERLRTYLVWPENAVMLSLDGTSGLKAAVSDLKKMRVGLVLGASIIDSRAPGEVIKNSVLSFGSDGELEASTSKSVAVPVIESSSSDSLSTAARTLIGAAGRGATISAAVTPIPLDGDAKALALLCFEVLFPAVAELRRPNGARVILNLADDSWVESRAVSMHLVSALRLRAIEQRLPALRVAHSGVTVSVDRFGTVVRELPENAYGSISEVTRSTPQYGLIHRFAPLLALAITSAITFLGFSYFSQR